MVLFFFHSLLLLSLFLGQVFIASFEAKFVSFLLLLGLLVNVGEGQHNIRFSCYFRDHVILEQCLKIAVHLCLDKFVLIDEESHGLVFIPTEDDSSSKLSLPLVNRVVFVHFQFSELMTSCEGS